MCQIIRIEAKRNVAAYVRRPLDNIRLRKSDARLNGALGREPTGGPSLAGAEPLKAFMPSPGSGVRSLRNTCRRGPRSSATAIDPELSSVSVSRCKCDSYNSPPVFIQA
jgi:hypothetical protein